MPWYAPWGISLLSIDVYKRQHQIRAHLAYLGHPVLGDIKYGNRNINEKTGFKTQALCAQRLTFGKDVYKRQATPAGVSHLADPCGCFCIFAFLSGITWVRISNITWN